MAQSNTIQIKNRKAKFEYEFIEEFNAGIILHGAEVKSVRAGKANLADAFCYFKKGELYIKNFHIADYKYNTVLEMRPTRERKLLLKKRELRKIHKIVKEKGLTIIPYRVFINERGWIKVHIAVAQGKKVRDKRQSIKERESKREMARAKKIDY
ncbi:SsrA-binding protein SmpB [Membranicola marinus]|uniref:SsrA-binding protein n=1 Tax=Membranihabitans marinus TaxID=1227546 RepID=A0A953HUW6_9BACT|nr:SsrA-binding protein SmpB [Membranihabitans marinus]MBY5958308.1 SsrA-binding protein SmpB [Membranihabitans marinus]